MATYKVIQDIEAEDKLLGPLSLRQFIYAVMVVVMGFIAYKLAGLHPLLIVPFLGPMAFFGLLAAPFGHSQSSEVWLLAKIRFFLKPRKRIWDQTGMKELVTITVPKKVERILSDGLSQTEVKSRLQALANTIDSRGWAVKNVNVNLSNPAYATVDSNTDRLVVPNNLPQEVQNYDIYAQDDIMDTANNPTAQALDAMISQSAQTHRQAAVATAQGAAPAGQSTTQQPADYWFMNQPDPSTIPAGQAAFAGGQTVTPGLGSKLPVSDNGQAEQALLQKLHKEKASLRDDHGHAKIIKPRHHGGNAPHGSQSQKASDDQADTPVQKTVDPKLLQLASNDDLNVSTIAREADKATRPEQTGADGEVVISLR